LAVVLFPPGLALVWLAATLFDQDQAMLAQRGLERQEAAAGIVTHSLAKSLSEAARWLVDDDLPEGAVRLTRSPDELDITPAGRVLWVPEPPRRPDAVPAAGDLPQVERLARTRVPAVRPWRGALIPLRTAPGICGTLGNPGVTCGPTCAAAIGAAPTTQRNATNPPNQLTHLRRVTSPIV
jgi:hypothetical protein